MCVDNVIRDTAHKCPYSPSELAVRFGLEEFERNNCEPPLHDPVEYRFQLLRAWRRKLGSKATYDLFLCCLKRCLPTNQTFLEDTEKLIITEHSVPTIANDTNPSSELLAMPMLNRANALLDISIESQKSLLVGLKRSKRKSLKLKRENKSLTKLVERLKKEKENLKLENEDMAGHLKECEDKIEFLKAENERRTKKLMLSIQVNNKPPEYCPIKSKEEEQSDSDDSFDFQDDMKLSDGIQFILNTS